MDRSVCVVTPWLGSRDRTATRELLEILSSITAVSLVTMALAETDLAEEYDVVEMTENTLSDHIPLAALQFVLIQLKMTWTLLRRDEEVLLFYGSVAYILPICVGRLVGRTVIVEPRANSPVALRVRWEQRVPGPVAGFLAKLVWGLERIGYTSAHAIITYTPSMARSYGIDPSASKVFPDGARFIDTDRFHPRVPFEDRKPTVGYLGRMDEEKGIRRLVEIAASLPPDVQFRLVGDGPLLEWAKGELAEEIEAGRVDCRGWVDHGQVPDELSQLRLLVLPSHPSEGLPTTILEAFACGTPVYAAPVSGVPDVVKPGETGKHMQSTDPEAAAAEIAALLDSGNLSEMSDRCRTLVEGEFTYEAAVERYSTILETVVRRHQDSQRD